MLIIMWLAINSEKIFWLFVMIFRIKTTISMVTEVLASKFFSLFMKDLRI